MKDFSPNFNSPDQQIISPEKLKILLWDIDGTLLRSTVQGGYKKYFSATMLKIFGSAGTLDRIIPSGMTDTQIMFEALKNEGFRTEQIFERKEDLLKIFKSEMSSVLANGGEPYETLCGVKEILTETDKNEIFINALLTGNLSVAAEIKLQSVGLWHFFENAPNAFGEISHERKDLAVEAGKLFNQKYDFDFSPGQFIVIGDTPNDVLCAKHFGAKCVAVLTGRNQTGANLKKENPDVIIDDLTDTKKLIEIFENL
jgi:phosphoglycolate phosphatase